MPVYWPGGKRTTVQLGPWLFPSSVWNVGLLFGWVVLWSFAVTAWLVYGYWLALKYTVLAGLAMIGLAGAITIFGWRVGRVF